MMESKRAARKSPTGEKTNDDKARRAKRVVLLYVERNGKGF